MKMKSQYRSQVAVNSCTWTDRTSFGVFEVSLLHVAAQEKRRKTLTVHQSL